jgi:group II intron reverse transcriptase/maturase
MSQNFVRFGKTDPPTPDLPSEVLFSHEALHRAWRMTRANGESPGVDRVSLPRFEARLDQELRVLRRELIDGSYKPQAVQRYYKTKASGKKRALSIWAVRDRVAQRVILEHITPPLESLYLSCSFGFRPGRTVGDALAMARQALARGKCWIVDADISDCFDSIPVPPLMKRVREAIVTVRAQELIELWLTAPVLDGMRGAMPTVAGVSQGSVISPQLTNLYLHTFDRTITTLLPGATLVRFADDFVILCGNRMSAQSALFLARQTLAGLGLKLNPAKTRILHVREGVEFLGQQLKSHP